MADVDALTKKIKVASIEYTCTIMTINVSNSKKKDSAKADVRRKHVTDLMVKEYPDIALMQECIKVDITKLNKRVKEDGKNEYRHVLKSGHSGLVKKNIAFTELHLSDKDLKTFKKLDEAGVKARLSLMETEVNKQKIIVGSWHGPNTGSDDSRKTVVKELCGYMNLIASGKPWIVGGDFNVKYKIIKKEVPSVTYGTEEEIIFFVHTESITVNNCKACSITNSEGVKCIDHYPLLANLSVEQSNSDQESIHQ